MSSGDWFIRPLPKHAPAARLICLPYAGGSAATYVPWARHLPAEVELIALQPPGRGARMAEAPHADMEALIGELLSVFPQVLDRPYVLFGHSLGSRVAFELTLQCQLRGLPMPARLIASGSRAPHLRERQRSRHDLPEAEFIAQLRDLEGTPEEVLSSRELIQLLLPLLRADFRIADFYRAAQIRLNCPLVVLAGTRDKIATAQEVAAWRELAGGECEIHWVAGGHFFIERNRAWLLEKLNVILARVCVNCITSSNHKRAGHEEKRE